MLTSDTLDAEASIMWDDHVFIAAVNDANGYNKLFIATTLQGNKWTPDPTMNVPIKLFKTQIMIVSSMTYN